MAVHPRKSDPRPKGNLDPTNDSIPDSSARRSLLHVLDVGPLKPSHAIQIVLELAENLQKLHDQRLVQGNLSLATIQMDSADHPQLINPSLPVDSLHTPEADLKNLGEILYELLTGQPPGSASMKTLVPEIPAVLEIIHAKTLPTSRPRYTSCSQLANDLRHFLKGTSTNFPGASGAFLQDLPGRRLISTSFAILAVLSLGLISLLLFQILQQFRKTQRAEHLVQQLQMDLEEARQLRFQAQQDQQEAQSDRNLAETMAQQLKREKQILEETVTATRQAGSKILDEKNGLMRRLNTLSQSLYLQYLALATIELQKGRPDQANRWLDPCQLDEKQGWEWRLLRNQAQKPVSTGWHRLSFRPPDGRWLAWAHGNTVILRRRVANPSPSDIRILEAPEPVISIAFTTDGRFLVAGCLHGAVRGWDLTTNEASTVFRDRHEGKVHVVACSADGQLVATAGDDRSVHLTRVGLGEWKTQVLKEIHATAITWLSFDPGGRQIASASQDGITRQWLVDSGKEIHAPLENTNLLAFQQQGRLHAIARDNGSVTLYNPDDKPVGGFPGFHDLKDLVLTRNDRCVTLDRQGIMTAWEIRLPDPAIETMSASSTGGCAISPEGDMIAWMPDLQRVVLRSPGQASMSTWNWNQSTGKNQFPSEVEPPNLETLSEPMALLVWEPTSRRLLTINHLRDRDEHPVSSLCRLWDAGQGKRIQEWKENRFPISACAISCKGVTVWGGTSGQIEFLDDPASGKRITLDAHEGTIRFLVFSPDGNRLVTAGSDRRLILWDVTSRKSLHTITDIEVVGGLAFTADNHFLFAGIAGGQILQWQTDPLKEIRKLQMPNRQGVQGLVTDPHSEWILGWSQQGCLQRWQIIDGQPNPLANGPGCGIVAIAVHPGENRLALACRDRTIRIWNSVNLAEILSLECEANPGAGLAFRPDGKELTATTSRGIRRWLAPTTP